MYDEEKAIDKTSQDPFKTAKVGIKNKRVNRHLSRFLLSKCKNSTH